jgi:hypothetical protein
MGLVRLADFTRTRRHPLPKEVPAAVGGPVVTGGPVAREAERVLRWVERNLTAFTRIVTMVEIEDLSPSM